MPRLGLGEGHDMKNVKCPKVDQNKRFSHMVSLGFDPSAFSLSQSLHFFIV
mgnify:FL=1|jgi:hypothetical protein